MAAPARPPRRPGRSNGTSRLRHWLPRTGWNSSPRTTATAACQPFGDPVVGRVERRLTLDLGVAGAAAGPQLHQLGAGDTRRRAGRRQPGARAAVGTVPARRPRAGRCPSCGCWRSAPRRSWGSCWVFRSTTCDPALVVELDPVEASRAAARRSSPTGTSTSKPRSLATQRCGPAGRRASAGTRLSAGARPRRLGGGLPLRLGSRARAHTGRERSISASRSGRQRRSRATPSARACTTCRSPSAVVRATSPRASRPRNHCSGHVPRAPSWLPESATGSSAVADRRRPRASFARRPTTVAGSAAGTSGAAVGVGRRRRARRAGASRRRAAARGCRVDGGGAQPGDQAGHRQRARRAAGPVGHLRRHHRRARRRSARAAGPSSATDRTAVTTSAVPGPGAGDVEQPALLGEQLRRARPAGTQPVAVEPVGRQQGAAAAQVGPDALLHAGDDHERPLQALGAVGGEQAYGRRREPPAPPGCPPGSAAPASSARNAGTPAAAAVAVVVAAGRCEQRDDRVEVGVGMPAGRHRRAARPAPGAAASPSRAGCRRPTTPPTAPPRRCPARRATSRAPRIAAASRRHGRRGGTTSRRPGAAGVRRAAPGPAAAAAGRTESAGPPGRPRRSARRSCAAAAGAGRRGRPRPSGRQQQLVHASASMPSVGAGRRRPAAPRAAARPPARGPAAARRPRPRPARRRRPARGAAVVRTAARCARPPPSRARAGRPRGGPAAAGRRRASASAAGESKVTHLDPAAGRAGRGDRVAVTALHAEPAAGRATVPRSTRAAACASTGPNRRVVPSTTTGAGGAGRRRGTCSGKSRMPPTSAPRNA